MESCGFTSRQNALAVRGFCALVITQVHLMYFVPPISLFYSFTNVGFLCVGIFFFYSGYGLFWNYLHKPNDWAKRFWTKKIIRLWLPFTICNSIYILARDLLIEHLYDPRIYIETFLWMREGNGYLWYLQTIFVFYFAAWCVLHLLTPLRSKLPAQLFGAVAALACFCVHVFLFVSFSSVVHEGMALLHLFPLSLLFGMLWCVFELQINHALAHKSLRSALQIVLFIVFFYIYRLCSWNVTPQSPLRVSLPSVSAPIILITWLGAMLYGISLENPLLDFFGTISGEIYIWHALFLYIFCNGAFMIQSNFLYVGLYLSCTFALAYITHTLNKKIEAHLLHALPARPENFAHTS